MGRDHSVVGLTQCGGAKETKGEQVLREVTTVPGGLSPLDLSPEPASCLGVLEITAST